MISTGLTDAEKESLLKFFLTHCEIKSIKNSGIFTHEVQFFNNPDKITTDTAVLIDKAMMNLRKSVWGVT